MSPFCSQLLLCIHLIFFINIMYIGGCYFIVTNTFITCYTSSLISCIHVNGTHLLNITCIWVARSMILGRLECTSLADDAMIHVAALCESNVLQGALSKDWVGRKLFDNELTCHHWRAFGLECRPKCQRLSIMTHPVHLWGDFHPPHTHRPLPLYPQLTIGGKHTHFKFAYLAYNPLSKGGSSLREKRLFIHYCIWGSQCLYLKVEGA